MADGEHGLRVTSLEERERVLDPFVAGQALELGDLDGLCELLGREVRRADRADLALAHELVECREGLLLRRVRVEVMRQVERNSLDPQPPEARLDLAPNPLAGETAVRAFGHRVEGLRLDGDRVADLRALRREPLADPRLAPSAPVRVGGVERPDPELPRGVHDPRRLLVRDPLPEEGRRGADTAEVAAAEDDPRDRHPAAPELARLHARDLRSDETRSSRARAARRTR